jgi:hypothetical protein
MNKPIQDVIDASGPYLEYVVARSVKNTRERLKFTLKIPVEICQDQIWSALVSDLVKFRTSGTIKSVFKQINNASCLKLNSSITRIG